ncbi:hypothetical protein [Celeribacter litoreus]|uniref:hypothetical protein n=1 Tax=Celeribacter litoreus TaxID=2876714 RepID=UPI001CCF1420|nr:hypothetical protein [Celeribacter litoreus]
MKNEADESQDQAVSEGQEADDAKIEESDAASEEVVEETPEDVDPVTDAEDDSIPDSDDEISSDETDADQLTDEVETPAEETPEPAAAEPAPAPVVEKKSGFVPMLIGGVICAGLGFGAAYFTNPAGDNEEVLAQISTLEERIADLSGETDRLSEAQSAAISELQMSVDEKLAATTTPSSDIEELKSQIEALEMRLLEAEARPVAEAVLSPEATAAFQSQIDEMQTLLNAEIERLKEAKAASLAEEAAAREATLKARLQTRVDAGEPFAALLDEIGTEVPPSLRAAAAEGIASTAMLQEDFATSARAALMSASKAAHEAGEQGWLATVLQTQLGLRSTEPKEGDGADAVLSRAEQAVREGKFTAAIEILGALPEAGKSEMQSWIAQAQERVDVLAALDAYLAQ